MGLKSLTRAGNVKITTPPLGKYIQCFSCEYEDEENILNVLLLL